jgi:hypothetical protein
MIAVAFLMSFARSPCLGIVHLEDGSISKGILNRECAVLPPSNNVAAVPDEVVAKTMSPLLHKTAIIAR